MDTDSMQVLAPSDQIYEWLNKAQWHRAEVGVLPLRKRPKGFNYPAYRHDVTQIEAKGVAPRWTNQVVINDHVDDPGWTGGVTDNGWTSARHETWKGVVTMFREYGSTETRLMTWHPCNVTVTKGGAINFDTTRFITAQFRPTLMDISLEVGPLAYR